MERWVDEYGENTEREQFLRTTPAPGIAERAGGPAILGAGNIGCELCGGYDGGSIAGGSVSRWDNLRGGALLSYKEISVSYLLDDEEYSRLKKISDNLKETGVIDDSTPEKIFELIMTLGWALNLNDKLSFFERRMEEEPSGIAHAGTENFLEGTK